MRSLSRMTARYGYGGLISGCRPWHRHGDSIVILLISGIKRYTSNVPLARSLRDWFINSKGLVRTHNNTEQSLSDEAGGCTGLAGS